MHSTKPRPRQLILLLCALFLLGAQQAAFAHLIGHFSFAAESVTQPGNENGNGSAPSLSHVCTTCLAFTALAAAVPPLAQFPAVPLALAETPVRAEFPRVPTPGVLPYAARAPPFPL